MPIHRYVTKDICIFVHTHICIYKSIHVNTHDFAYSHAQQRVRVQRGSKEASVQWKRHRLTDNDAMNTQNQCRLTNLHPHNTSQPMVRRRSAALDISSYRFNVSLCHTGCRRIGEQTKGRCVCRGGQGSAGRTLSSATSRRAGRRNELRSACRIVRRRGVVFGVGVAGAAVVGKYHHFLSRNGAAMRHVAGSGGGGWRCRGTWCAQRRNAGTEKRQDAGYCAALAGG